MFSLSHLAPMLYLMCKIIYTTQDMVFQQELWYFARCGIFMTRIIAFHKVWYFTDYGTVWFYKMWHLKA